MQKFIAMIKESNTYYLLVLVIPLLFFISERIKSWRNLPPERIKSWRNLPPGPFPWPVIGNILNMGNKPHISLAQFATVHGPLISLRLGTQLLIVGSTSAAAAKILKTHDRILSGRYVPHAAPESPDRFHLSLGFADCTEQWKYLRTVCRTELFSAKVIESQAKIRDKKVTELVDFLRTREGRMVKIAEVVFNTIFNTLSNIFVSKDFIDLHQESEGEVLKGFVRKYLELLSIPNLADYYTILSDLDLQGLNKKSNEIFVQIFGIWEPIIKERRGEKCSDVSRRRDFLDGLLDRRFTNYQINFLFLELFLAASDTSTSTVEWVMAELLKNPEAMENVRNELHRQTNETVIKEADLAHLPYLNSVVLETLRLHPPAPFLLPHRAVDTCKVMNYTVPKDSQVIVNAWAIGRDPNTWEEPITFKPERFLEASMDLNSSNFGFIPFGAGRRNCPGQPMAAKLVPLILACLINSFNWSLPHDMHPTELNMEEKFGITLHMEKPLVLIPK